MSNCQIRFKYGQEDIVILCKRNELMRDILNRYAKNLELSINEFRFLYNDIQINTDLILSQINNKDKEIIINVYPKEIEGNKNEIKKSDLINSIKCTDISTKSSENEIVIKIKIEQRDLIKLSTF